jgi:deoxyadenosine/deoxycytidine kinase
MRGISPESLMLASPEVRPKNFFAEFIGVPASRKTTSVRSLAAKSGYAMQLEIPVAELPIFKDYYRNPREFALPFQKMIFERSLEQVLGGGSKAGVMETCETRPLLREPIIWQHLLYARARLSPEELEEYLSFVQEKIKGQVIPRPHTVFYTYMSQSYMLEAISQRAEQDPLRQEELKAPVEYWMRLWHTIDDWVYTNPLGLHIVKMDMEQFDYKKFSSKEACEIALTSMFNGWVDYYSEKGAFQ